MNKRLSQRALRLWARAAVSVFYRRVNIDGREHLPAGGPTLFAANHSNALADVAVIVAKIARLSTLPGRIHVVGSPIGTRALHVGWRAPGSAPQ